MARGFCTCKRDAPGKPHLHPPENATWHFLCDKPVLPPAQHEPDPAKRTPRPYLSDADWSLLDIYSGTCVHLDNQGQPYDPPGWAHATMHDEAQRIAEVFDEARAEQDRGL